MQTKPLRSRPRRPLLGDPLRPHEVVDGVNSLQAFEGATAVSPMITEFEIAGRCVQNTC